MGTILGIETEAGTVLAGDRLHVEEGTEVSAGVRRVFGFDGAGAAAIGEPGAIDEFERRLDAETRRYRIERGDRLGIERLARSAAPIAEDAGVDAIVSALDGGATARIRSVGRDGSVLADAVVAFGSGARLALGRLEGIDRSGDLDEVERRARDVFSLIGERDPGTGTGVDTWTLESDPRDGSGGDSSRS